MSQRREGPELEDLPGLAKHFGTTLIHRQRQAAVAGVPYQTFMKSILEAAVPRLERRARPPARRTGSD